MSNPQFDPAWAGRELECRGGTTELALDSPDFRKMSNNLDPNPPTLKDRYGQTDADIIDEVTSRVQGSYSHSLTRRDVYVIVKTYQRVMEEVAEDGHDDE